MAYIICGVDEALLTLEPVHPSEQPLENLAVVRPGQKLAVRDHSVRLLAPDLALLTTAGSYTWTAGVNPIPAGSVLYFNPVRFHILEDAWEGPLVEEATVAVARPAETIPESPAKISPQEILSLANHFDLEPETVMAVLEVESNGVGFLDSGRCKILFEAHWFGEFTQDRFNTTHPHISCRTWTEARRNYKGGEAEWERLEEAKRLDAEAALKATSWGLGQVMGFNHKSCGYQDVFAFAEDMGKSEAKQLEIMFRFIESKQLLGELRKHDWAGFAYHYNGEGYKQNHYDDKLRRAYERHRQQGTFAGHADATRRDHPPPSESVRSPFDPGRPIDWSDNNCRISRYFTVGEVTNRDPQRIPQRGSEVEKNCLALARALDDVREQWGGPIGVTSWYRPEHVNRAVGGVPGSQHILGLAADIYTFDSSREREFEDWLDRDPWKDRALGYGVRSGRGFTHVDLRSGRIRWTY